MKYNFDIDTPLVIKRQSPINLFGLVFVIVVLFSILLYGNEYTFNIKYTLLLGGAISIPLLIESYEYYKSRKQKKTWIISKEGLRFTGKEACFIPWTNIKKCAVESYRGLITLSIDIAGTIIDDNHKVRGSFWDLWTPDIGTKKLIVALEFYSDGEIYLPGKLGFIPNRYYTLRHKGNDYFKSPVSGKRNTRKKHHKR